MDFVLCQARRPWGMSEALVSEDRSLGCSPITRLLCLSRPTSGPILRTAVERLHLFRSYLVVCLLAANSTIVTMAHANHAEVVRLLPQ